jgi:hypothetical protein
MKDSRVFDLLKLRASFGMSGSSDSSASSNLTLNSDAGGRYLYKDYYIFANPFGNFYTGESTATNQSTLMPMYYPNKDARSETSYKYNIGVDMTMWGGRFNLTADAFLDNRTGIQTYDQNILNYYGWNNAVLNIGKMVNRGFEVAAVWADKVGEVSYSLGGSVSFARNKIIEYGELPTTHDYNAATGRPYATPIGLVADGFYGVDDFDANGDLKDGIATPLFGDVQPGDIRYRDLDDNGIVDTDDITAIGGSIYPEWNYTLRAKVAWKGLDLDILMQGTAGADMNLLSYKQSMVVPYVSQRTIYRFADNSWAYYPEQGIDNREGATYPRLTLETNGNNHRTSSFWMRSLDYLKIRHIELGYTFKTRGMDNLRVYVNAANPLTFSKLKREMGIDPESIGSYYPTLQSYTLGVSLSF